MRTSCSLAVATLTLLGIAQFTSQAVRGQSAPSGPAAPSGSSGPAGRGAAFQLPEMGATLPDVSVYDEQGQKFSTSSLRGRYTVLVFGCLT